MCHLVGTHGTLILTWEESHWLAVVNHATKYQSRWEEMKRYKGGTSNVHLHLWSTPRSGAARDPGHGTKIMRGNEGWYSLLFQDII